VRKIGVNRSERDRAIDEPLREQPRDDALAHAALFSAYEVYVTHEARRSRPRRGVKRTRSLERTASRNRLGLPMETRR
jgi:hypothetical protein